MKDTNYHGQGACAVSGAGRANEVAPGPGCSPAAAAMRKRGIQNLGSGARRLREYACDANAI
eukprot:5870871-Pleurochrysis_carterae.AAC.1